MKTIGQIIADERKKANRGLLETALAIGMSKEGLWQLERYKQSTSIVTLNKICDYFNLDKKKMAMINFISGKPYREYQRYIQSL